MILPAKEIIFDRIGWETDSKDGPIPVGIAAAAAAMSLQSPAATREHTGGSTLQAR